MNSSESRRVVPVITTIWTIRTRLDGAKVFWVRTVSGVKSLHLDSLTYLHIKPVVAAWLLKKMGTVK